jgi:hypothetical protein
LFEERWSFLQAKNKLIPDCKMSMPLPLNFTAEAPTQIIFGGFSTYQSPVFSTGTTS